VRPKLLFILSVMISNDRASCFLEHSHDNDLIWSLFDVWNDKVSGAFSLKSVNRLNGFGLHIVCWVQYNFGVLIFKFVLLTGDEI